MKAERPPSTQRQKSVPGGSLIKSLALVGLLIVVGTASLQADLIVNGDFTANAAQFTTWPGYAGGSNPTTISNWSSYLDASGIGLNGAGTTAGNAFGPTDTGGKTYAFIQGGGQAIYQYLAFTPNTNYTLNIDIAGRAGDAAPKFSVKFAGGDLVPFWDSDVLYGGGLPIAASQGAFTHYSVNFTTPASLPTGAMIQLWNESPAGDNTVCYVNISIPGIPAPDTTPPSISCPPNVTVHANPGQNYATNVAIFSPVASDNSGSVTVTNNAPAQSPMGVTTVTWTAVDPSGNLATCEQGVTVTGPLRIDLALVPPNHPVQLTLTGGTGRAQRIESSTNLIAWTPLATVPQTNATLQWVDSDATNLPQRFYRSLKLTALDVYVATPDLNYTYSLVNTIPGTGQTTFVLEMTSQAWLTTNEVNRTLWKHWLIIVKPNGVAHSKSLLYISGGSNDDPAPTSADSTLLQIALDTQTVVTELRMVPNQPLTFAGESFSRSEDAFMSYTWDKFLRTGDDKWPSLLPMTKAAVRAMDTVSAFCASTPGGGINVDAFVVMGGSKRGWTTWTTAIVDHRVVAIIPIVIDLLNLKTSFIHHYRCYGGWAPAIQDYVNIHIMDRLTTPEFGALMAILDPYEYRSRLTLPKYIINSTGDQFFLSDSSQFYFDDLPGVKYLRYVPNTDHNVFGGSDAWDTVEACYQAVLTSAALPQFSWTLPTSNSIRVVTDTSPSNVKLWQATNPNARDFRLQTIGAVWQSTPLADQGGGVYVGTVPTPPQGFTAFFVELTYPGSGATPFKFTTRVKVVPDIEPFGYPP